MATSDIVVSGLGCRFPGGVCTANEFWQMLVDGRCGIQDVPKDRQWEPTGDWVHQGEGPLPKGKSCTGKGGFIDIDRFDPAFFSISPKEAAAMDPQQRVALEVGYEALRSAHLTPQQLSDNSQTGVFVGVGDYEHGAMGCEHPEHMTAQYIQGNALAVIANRVSFCFNFKGPSFSVDTACSSVLTAFHFARLALLNGDCDTALVYGVNGCMGPGYFVAASQGGMLSPSGTLSPFDERANGYVRAEGCGCVVLQRRDSPSLSPRTLAIVRGSGCNDDGKTASLTYPSPEQQGALMAKVLRESGVDRSEVAYLEAHGTGTQAGDPMEVSGVATIYRGHRLPIGSVKGNVGHLEAGSGIASLAKALLLLRHRKLVPTVGHARPNPRIDFGDCYVPVEVTDHAALETGCVAVNSFGFGGANGHAILQAPPRAIPERTEDGVVVALPVAMHYREGVDQYIRGFGNLGNDAILAQAHSGDFSGRQRAVLVGEAGPDFFASAERVEIDPFVAPAGRGRDRSMRVGFVFGGQGSNHVSMGADLYRRFAAFRAAIDEFDAAFAALSGKSLLRDYGFCGSVPMSKDAMGDVLVSVPCIVAVQVGLVGLMRDFNVTPTAVLGHSIGEMAAAHAAGALSVADLARLTFARATAQSQMAGGAMAAVGKGPKEALEIAARLGIELEVAAVNTPESITLSGTNEAIDTFGRWATQRKEYFVKLGVPRAYHSRHTEPVAPVFRDLASGAAPGAPQCTFVSSVDSAVRTGVLDVDYWWRNVRQTVNFNGGLTALCEHVDMVVELSPHSVLRQYVDAVPGVGYVHALRRGKPESKELLKAVGAVFCKGTPVSWRPVGTPKTWDIDLPRMPWKHQALRLGRFLLGPGQPVTEGAVTTAKGGAAGPSGFDMVLAGEEWKYVFDHIIKGAIVVPGAMLMSIALELPAPTGSSVVDMEFRRMLTWPKGSENLDFTTLFDGSAFTMMREGVLRNKGSLQKRRVPDPIDDGGLRAAEARCAQKVDVPSAYRVWAKHADFSLGPAWRVVQAVQLGDGEAVATIRAPPDGLRVFHPTVLDGCFQSLIFLAGLSADAFVPTHLQQLTLLTDKMPTNEAVRVHGRLIKASQGSITVDIDVYRQNGTRLAAIRGITGSRPTESSNPALKLIAVSKQSRVCPDLTTDGDDRISRVASAVADALSKSRVPRCLVSKETADAVKEKDAALAEPGQCMWTIAEEADPREHADYDIVATGGADAAVRACLVEGGHGFTASGGMLRGVAPDGDVRRCKVLGTPDAVMTALMKKYPDRVSVAQADPEIIVDCRGTLWEASALIAEVAPKKEAAPVVVFMARNAPQLWGFARTARNEFPRLTVLAVEQEEDTLERVVRTKVFGDYEIYTGDRVPRIRDVPADTSSEAKGESHYRLQIERPGQLQTLGFHAIDVGAESMGSDEVRVSTKAISLHFRDVMIAMNMLQGFAPVFGIECSGTVAEIGADAQKRLGLKAGDSVLCMSLVGSESRPQRKSLMGSTVVVPSTAVIPAPKGVDLTLAAGFLGVMATAYHSLVKLAAVKKGDVVLVHSATGGVGQCAIQVARRAGATVIGSAGTAEKRKRLTQEFGCALAIDSHEPTTFHPEVMRFTGGKGVDCVLNSLSGLGLSESLRCLAPAGKFVEIGKYDILENSALRMRLLKQNIAFFSFHIDLLADTHPEAARGLLLEVNGLLEKGELKPIETEVVPFSKAQDAFQRMSKGQHSGKIVLEVEKGFVPPGLRRSYNLFKHGAAYLFTGSTRGVGLAMAAWAVTQGATRIILTGSSGRAPRKSMLMLEGLKQRHPELEYHIEKLVTLTDARTLFQKHANIRGVFHLATQYSSESSDKVTPESVVSGFSVKADGAKALHAVTRASKDIDIFFLASSTAGLAGNPNQAVYASANGYLQWLAGERRRLGLPGVSFDLPAVLGAGRLSQFEFAQELEILTGKGVVPVAIGDVCKFVGRVLASPEHYPAHVTLDAPQWVNVIGAMSQYKRLFEHHIVPQRRRAARARAVGDAGKVALAKLSFILGTPAADIDVKQSLAELGIDSLAAVELMNWCATEFGVTVAQTDLLSGMTAEELISRLKAAPTADGGAGDDDGDVVRVAVSEDEAKKLVTGKVGFLLGVDASEVEMRGALSELGVDSLGAVELMNWCSSEFGVTVAQTELLSGMTVGELCAAIVKGSAAAASSEPRPAPAAAAPAAAAASDKDDTAGKVRQVQPQTTTPVAPRPAAAPAAPVAPAPKAPASAAPKAPAAPPTVPAAVAARSPAAPLGQDSSEVLRLVRDIHRHFGLGAAQRAASTLAPAAPGPVLTPARVGVKVSGLSCRLPGDVWSPADLWQMLLDGRCGIGELPTDRHWDPKDWVSEELEVGKCRTSRGGFVDVDKFDPQFFGISPKEAPVLCVFHRGSLEVAYEAIRSAHLTPEMLAAGNARTGVFVAATASEHGMMQMFHPETMTQHTMPGNTIGNCANRVSFTFNFNGPSFAADTACSSVLTALHMAVLSLQEGSCDTALVIGTGAHLLPGSWVGFSQAHMLSPTGTSRPFDEKANGFVRGEGFGCVLLQRSDSPALSKRCIANLRGSGINVQGRQASITQPAKGPQMDLMEEVMAKHDVRKEEIVFIEAHGTGTQAGDPTEATAIGTVLGGARPGLLPIGSVKGNVGHLETCSGLPGIAKALLMLQHKKLVPTVGYETPNPKIDFEHLKVQVQTQVEDYPELESGCIGVNSFGFGGANGHVILQNEPVKEPLPTVTEGEVIALPLALHYKDGLPEYVRRFETASTDAMLAHAVGGDHEAGRNRLVLVGPAGKDFFSAAERVEGEAKLQARANRGKGSLVRVGFVFGGQGSHHPKMGSELYQRFPAFREAVNRFDECYKAVSGVSLMKDHGFCGEQPMDVKLMTQLQVTLPCMLAVQVGLIHVLRDFGVRPSAVLGHSNGETAAAYAAGIGTMEQLCAFALACTSALAEMPDGAMAAAGCSRETALEVIAAQGIQAELDVACINSPDSITLSGTAKGVKAFGEWAAQHKVFFRVLEVTKAYHSRFTKGVKEIFMKALGSPKPHPSQVPFISSVEGRHRKAPLDPNYWWSNICSPVEFHNGMLALQEHCDMVVEVSPHSVLRNYVVGTHKVPYVHTLRVKHEETREFTKAVAAVWCQGGEVDWAGAGTPSSWNVEVPQMPWNHRAVRHGYFLHGDDLPSVKAKRAAGGGSSGFNMVLDPHSFGYVSDHVVKGAVVVPAAMYIALGLELPSGKGQSVCDMQFKRMLTWQDAAAALEITMLWDGEVFQVTKGGTLHAKGIRANRPVPPPIAEDGIEGAVQRCSTMIKPATIYSLASRFGDFSLGPRFQTVLSYGIGDAERVVTMPAPEDQLRLFHPAIMDACFQAIGFVPGVSRDPIVPTGLDQMTVLTESGAVPREPLKAHVAVRKTTTMSVTADVDVYTHSGERVVAIRGFTMSAAAVSTDASLRLLGVKHQERRCAVDAKVEAPAAGADVDARAAAVAAVVSAGVEAGRVMRCLVSKDVLSAVRAADASLLDAGKAVWSTTDFADPEEHRDFDVVCTDGMEVGVRGCLVEGGYGILAAGGLVRGVAPAAPTKARRCLIIGEPDATLKPLIERFAEVGTAVASPEIVIDCRGSLPAASRLMKEYGMQKDAPVVVFLAGHAPHMWGFARTARNEFPALTVLAVEQSEQNMARLVCQESFAEVEVAADGSVPRIVNVAEAAEEVAGAAGGFRLKIDRVGQLNSLGWAPIDVEAEGMSSDEVRLAVKAVGVNFKDVAVAMGLLQGFSPLFGLECGGVVSAIGEEAAKKTGLKVGDSALACCFKPREERDSLMGSTAVVPSSCVVKAPSNVDLVKAAGFPVVMGTAYETLANLARVRAGETVLVHSATGGLGQAAIQVAQRAGAKVIGSAGTAEKRAMLTARLGCIGAIDSHDPATFVHEVSALTDGRGVDVVLNSLPGDGQTESMRCLAAGGRFVEVGKTAIQADAALRQSMLKDNISFFSFHLDLLGQSHPERAHALLSEVLQLLADGELKLIETQVMPMQEVKGAFQRLASGSGSHTGKVVLQLEAGWVPEGLTAAASVFRRGASYLFTGATRGVGLWVAAWAASQGARRLILTGSSGRAPRQSMLQIQSLQARYPGLEVRIAKLDLADAAAVQQMFDEEKALRGVFHFATQYTSETSDNVTADGVAAGWSAKADGARILDQITRKRGGVDIFFMAASLAGLVGNQNQALYSSANSYLQWLAEDRRAAGLPGLALDLPAIIGAGRLSEFQNATELEILVGKGIQPVSVHDATRFIARLLAHPARFPAHVALDGPQWAGAIAGVSRHTRLFEHHVVTAKRRRRAAGGGGAADPVAAVREKIASVLGCKPADVDMEAPLTDAGVDSLAAVELMNWVNSDFGVSVPQSDLLGGLTAAQLADRLPKAGDAPAADDDDDEAAAHDPAQVSAAVREKVAQVLSSKPDDVPMDSPLTDLGLDSLAAVELMNWCSSEFGVSVPQSDLLSGLTLEGLVKKLTGSE
eukprot:TRINITY_DN624_c0_g3_i1.p1 TRINITY_DN624_c0_g3~~TRINITY_DN624_c0_g3_i1.p1  ORF type:complete len:4504 (+),score=1497.62 TRINITY_DN624_c0_g3_i1:83-13594(+)